MAGGRAIATRWLLRPARRLSRWLASWRTVDIRLVAAVVAVASFVLGLIGLRLYVPHQPASAGYGHSWPDIVYYDLQLYAFASAPAAGRGPFSVWLEIARFLAPFGTLLVALAALRLVLAEQFRRYLAAHARHHAIVTGGGSVPLTLARNLRQGTDGGKGARKRVVLISTSDDTLAEARRYDVLTVRGDPSDEATLAAAGAARADELYACAAHGIQNTNIAMLAGPGQLAKGRKQPLSAYALISSAELGVELRARGIGASGAAGLRLDFFSLEDSAARKLLKNHPLARGADPAQVVIIGFGPFGQAVLRETARQQLSWHGGPRVQVFVRDATEPEVQQVTDAFPAIGYGCSITCGQELKLPATGQYTVFVCLDDDDNALRESMDVARQVASGRGRVVACMRDSAPFARTLAGLARFLEDLWGRISVFEVIEEACMPANIRDDAFIEQLAQSIHEEYVAKSKARGETPAKNKSMVSWKELPQDLKDANVAQAAGIGAKLEAVNAVVIPESAAAPGFSFTDKEVEDLAEVEHDRWRRERIAQGWTYGPQRNNLRKIHPDLVAWADLAESERDKDRDAVRAIPGILREAGYQVLRVPPES